MQVVVVGFGGGAASLWSKRRPCTIARTTEGGRMAQGGIVEQILADYAELEPDQADSWNPVGSKFQLGYRLNLFYALATALGQVDRPLSDLAVLDLGCGNGRSARQYLDVGLRPEQVAGLDLRPGALALARQLNPAIRWVQHDGGALPVGHNWISATTVFSSVAGAEARGALAAAMETSLPAGGYLFYFDARRANPFAGGDAIDPRRLFGGLSLVWGRRFGRFSSLPMKERLRGLIARRGSGDARTASLRELVGDALAPSQEAFLFERR